MQRSAASARNLGLLARGMSAAIVAVLALLALVPAAGATTSSAPSPLAGHPYRHGFVPTIGSPAAVAAARARNNPLSANDMNYQGGISGVGVTTGKEQVYLVFWGSQWGSSSTNGNGDLTFANDSEGFAPYLQEYMKGLGTNNETWDGVATQYCQGVPIATQICPTSNTQHVAYPTGGALAGVWADTSAASPQAATGHQLGVEAVNAATHFGNLTQASNRNTQYVIVSAHGTDPDDYQQNGFCAWHDYTGDSSLDGGGAVPSPDGLLAFTNLPYLTDLGYSCGQNFVNPGSAGTLDGVSIVEGHEYTETITDQYPAGGWIDASGEEIGDKCAWINSGPGQAIDLALATGSFAVQSMWANDDNADAGGCESSHPIVTNPSPNTVTVTNPGSQTGTVGTAVNLQIQASDSSTSATLTYSATGLPAGLSINSSTGDITGTPTTAANNSVTVTATDNTGASGSASFSWTINPASSCNGGQLLGNPGFETGTAAPWTQNVPIVQPASAGEPAHSGNYLAWLGFNDNKQAVLAQQVTLPTGCTNYTWSFWLHVDTTNTGTTQSAQLRVQLVSGSKLLAVLGTFTNLNAASGYVQESYDLSAYAGQTLSVRFVASQESSSSHTNFVVDDNALNVS
jgi:hypothetical protein